MNEPIVIVAGTDDNYAIPLAVTLCSAISNMRRRSQVHIFIIDGGISKANRKKLEQSLRFENVRTRWVKPDSSRLKSMVISHHITLAAYYRLLIPELLPLQYKKVIYLDSDLVVKGDIEDFWNTDLQGKSLGAVQDTGILHVSDKRLGIKKYEELGIPANTKYFNSGVLVIDVEKWRDQGVSDRCITYVEKYKEHIRLHDQEALNVVLADDWVQLDPRWNQQFSIFECPCWQDSSFAEEDYNRLRQEPLIVHYSSTAAKPWLLGCNHPLEDLYFKYIDKTAWAGWRMHLLRKIYLKLEEVLDRRELVITPSLRFRFPG
jgi:lipopolysaccharide biosynthesis glycosyltransferase